MIKIEVKRRRMVIKERLKRKAEESWIFVIRMRGIRQEKDKNKLAC